MDKLLRRRNMMQAGSGGGGHVYPEGLEFYIGASFYIQNDSVYTDTYNNKRACAFVRTQVNNACQYTHGTLSGWTDPAYGIPIPPGCTKLTCLCENLQFAANVHRDVDSNTAYEVDSGFWSATGGTENYDLTSFIASGATHVSLAFKNASNTSLTGYTIDENTVQIYFD